MTDDGRADDGGPAVAEASDFAKASDYAKASTGQVDVTGWRGGQRSEVRGPAVAEAMARQAEDGGRRSEGGGQILCQVVDNRNKLT